MLDSPWLLFSLSTWLFFVLDVFRGSSKDILTKGTFLSEHSFMVRIYEWVVGTLYSQFPGAISVSQVPFPISHFPGPKSQVPSPKSQSQSLDNINLSSIYVFTCILVLCGEGESVAEQICLNHIDGEIWRSSWRGVNILSNETFKSHYPRMSP